MSRLGLVILTAYILFILNGLHLIGIGYATDGPMVIGFRVNDVITSSTVDQFREALELAWSSGSPLLIILDTPGGSLDATLEMVGLILNSRTPVITYVYPMGAKAWSAGSFILVAGHIAAMAPGTVTGSAQPVAYNPIGGSEPVTDTKVLNAVSKYIEEIALARGRNGTAAREFVLENLNLGPEEALRLHVIDLVAGDIDELLRLIDGWVVSIGDRETILRVGGGEVSWYEPGFRHYLLSLITNPLITFIMFMAGLYGLIFGLANSEVASASIGTLLIILSLLGMGFSINIVSILLIGLGVILLIVEALVIPGFGAAGVVGAMMILLGGLLAPINIDPSRWIIHPEWYNQLLIVSLVTAIPLAGYSLVIVYKVVEIRRRKSIKAFDMAGVEGIAVDDIGPGRDGYILCMGEYWLAKSDEEINSGDRVIVVSREGLKLRVRRKGG